MSVSHHHHLSAQRIFKDSSLHFAFRANTFLMLLPLRPHPPSIQQPQLPISKGKTKAGKQGNEGISFGSAFWALTLTEADLSGFARLLLDSLSTAATSLWIFWNVVWKVAIDHLRIPLFFFSSLSGQRDEATRMIAWACYVNHAGNAVCPSVTLYWMWQRTSTGTRWHVVSRTQKKTKQKEHSVNRFVFALHHNTNRIGRKQPQFGLWCVRSYRRPVLQSRCCKWKRSKHMHAGQMMVHTTYV